ncbi:hypothetical protein BJX64DRAFT_260652 [Aspergillus heterothallicus]
MPHLPELSNKEPSTKELIDKFRSRDGDIGETAADPESRLAEGVQYDRNNAPALQDREKGRSEKVNVEGGHQGVLLTIPELIIHPGLHRPLNHHLFAIKFPRALSIYWFVISIKF